MEKRDEILEVLLEILSTGLLRIRSFAYSGSIDECGWEADHLHNIPEIIKSPNMDLIEYYYNAERISYMRLDPVDGVATFQPLWERLEVLILHHNAVRSSPDLG